MNIPKIYDKNHVTGEVIERDATPEEIEALLLSGWTPGPDEPDPLP